MNKHMSFNTWFLSALTLLAVSIAGCGRETINVPDTTPPYVLSTVPALGAAGVAVGAPISATFSKPVNCSTLTTTTFTVAAAGTGGAAVGGAVTCSGSTATFTPTTALVLHTLYTAAITTGSQTWPAMSWPAPMPGTLKQWQAPRWFPPLLLLLLLAQPASPSTR